MLRRTAVFTFIMLISLAVVFQAMAQDSIVDDPEANKAIVLREFEEIWNQKNLDVIAEIYSPANTMFQ